MTTAFVKKELENLQIEYNVISDKCTLVATFRYYEPEFMERAMRRIKVECQIIAERIGGTVIIESEVSTHSVYNDPKLASRFEELAKEDPELTPIREKPSMGSEDFSWFQQKAPGFIFNFGVRNEEKGCVYSVHDNRFKADEDGMRYAMKAFVDFVMDFR